MPRNWLQILLRLMPLLPLVLPHAALGVVIVPGSSSNTTAPSGVPAWNNVGYLTGAGIAGTGVYLGDRWVLTARHVQGGNSGENPYYFVSTNLPSGSNSFQAIPFSAVNIGSADLTLFRLQTAPGLTALQFSQTPSPNWSATVIGTGLTQNSTGLHHWRLTGSSDPTAAVWTEVTNANLAQRHGYFQNTSSGYVERWGTNVLNQVDASGAVSAQFGTQTWLLQTTFKSASDNAQLASQDSGGGLFIGNRLAGINLYVDDDRNGTNSSLGQPANTSVFGNTSYFADLSKYVDQIAKITLLKPGMDGDANLDGIVNSVDFDTLYANMGKTSAGWTQGDFNLDSIINLQDLQILEVNFGRTSAGTGGASQSGGSSVPEPSALGALGLALAMLARRRR